VGVPGVASFEWAPWSGSRRGLLEVGNCRCPVKGKHGWVPLEGVHWLGLLEIVHWWQSRVEVPWRTIGRGRIDGVA
jgi:hypothetical protein